MPDQCRGVTGTLLLLAVSAILIAYFKQCIVLKSLLLTDSAKH